MKKILMYQGLKTHITHLLSLFSEKRCILCTTPFFLRKKNLPHFSNLKKKTLVHGQKEISSSIFLERSLETFIQSQLCEHCAQGFSIKKKAYCHHCGHIFSNEDTHYTEQKICAECSKKRPLWENFYFTNIYEDSLRALILQAKFNNSMTAMAFLGNIMAYTWCVKYLSASQLSLLPLPDIVIPMPLHNTRLKERGYNQCILLAQFFKNTCFQLLKQLNHAHCNKELHCLKIDTSLLYRSQFINAQSELNQQDRHENVKNSFHTGDNAKLKDKYILLLDDITTTNATIKNACKTLLSAGVKQVDVLVLAKTSHIK